MSIAKEEAKRLLDAIPDDANWDDIMYQFYVRKKIEAAIEAAVAGHVVPQEEMEKRFPSR